VSLDKVLATGASMSDVARTCGVTPQAVHQWRERGVPAEHVQALCLAYKLDPNSLRPDIFQPGWRYPRGRRRN
jgi:DNA-binding transcriptional regulator YdaS (Cro superfamily)